MNRILRAEIRRNCLMALCLVGLPLSIRAEEEQELLTLVRAGHRSAQEAIHSLSCTVRVESGFPTVQGAEEGKYWRSFDRARIQQEQPTGTVDYYYLIPDSELRTVTRNRPGTGQPAWWAGRQVINYEPQSLDVWRHMYLEFDVLLPHANGTPRAKRERTEGRDCVRVTMNITVQVSGTEIQHTFWFDVGRNYLLWKRVDTVKQHRGEQQILEFIEPQPGVFFPTKKVGKSFHGREQRGQDFFTLADVRINEPVAKGIFELPRVPRGTMCTDWIKKQRYPIDATWQQTSGSRAEPFELSVAPVSSPGQRGFSAPSTTESRSWTFWIAPASLAVLALAGAIWLYRRYRSRPLET